MNKQRRKRLQEAVAAIESAMEIIEEVKEQEETAFENLPESFQEGERGELMQEAIGCMDEQLSYLEDTVGSLQEFTEG